MFNEIESAGDRIHSITKIPKQNQKEKSCLYYLLNFEIWGSYKEWGTKDLPSRRNTALGNLTHLTTIMIYDIKEFKLNHLQYSKYVSQILLWLTKCLAYYDIIKTILTKKKVDNESLDGSEKRIVINNHFPLPKETTKIASIDYNGNDNDPDTNLNLAKIYEEEKDSSYNIMSEKSKGIVKSRWNSSRPNPKTDDIQRPRNVTSSIFSRDTTVEASDEVSKSKFIALIHSCFALIPRWDK